MVKKIFGQCYIWLILLLMYLPVLVLIAFSFTEATNVGKWSGFSFNLYAALFQSEEILIALGNTVLIALISAALATLIGSLGAIGAYYSKKRMRNTIDLATQIPVVNAEIVVAFSLTVMFVFVGALIGSFTSSLVGFLSALVVAVVVYLYIINFQSRFTERERNKWLSSRGLPDVIIMLATPIKNYFGHKLTFKKKPIES